MVGSIGLEKDIVDVFCPHTRLRKSACHVSYYAATKARQMLLSCNVPIAAAASKVGALVGSLRDLGLGDAQVDGKVAHACVCDYQGVFKDRRP